VLAGARPLQSETATGVCNESVALSLARVRGKGGWSLHARIAPIRAPTPAQADTLM